ncbi:MAG TPA: pirin family protein [Pyrinomonadaceae bacterium]|jgi:redox-sensitive bicupin YhaK (pirin superfamily)|nr:pirin family protein [Pyrinomonadaceae bacterium]
MITVRPSGERGRTRAGWLDSSHTFSFSNYYDPRHVGFRSLRVINEDYVAPGTGFGTHSHRDMEIISVVLSGGLAHRDSTGGSGVLRPGEAQMMTAGAGVSHSEMNASKSEQVHFLQIWILPESEGLRPGYEQKSFPDEERRGRLRLLASRGGEDGSLTIHQDVRLYDARLSPGQSVSHTLGEGRHAWLQVVSGSVSVNGTALGAGDGAAVSQESALDIRADDESVLLLFDLK